MGDEAGPDPFLALDDHVSRENRKKYMSVLSPECYKNIKHMIKHHDDLLKKKEKLAGMSKEEREKYLADRRAADLRRYHARVVAGTYNRR